MKKIYKILLCFILSISFYGCSTSSTTFKITILKIGKADAIILETTTHTILIDTGEDDDAEEILSYLQENNINQIDYLIITHYDKDHVGGADIILNNITVKQVIQPNYQSDSTDYLEYIDAMSALGIEATSLTEEMSFTLDDVTFTIIPPDTYLEDDDNNNSLITTAQHNQNSFLFAADAEETLLQELIDKGLTSFDFLKVPHHGRYNDISEQFLTIVSPKYAVITCSNKNPASDEILEILDNLNTETYQTVNGNITVTSNGYIDINQ